MQVGGEWADLWHTIWALGPRGVGANILLSQVSGFTQSPEWPPKESIREDASGSQAKSDGSVGAERPPDWLDRVKEIEGSVVTGFQLCTLNGKVLVCRPVRGLLRAMGVRHTHVLWLNHRQTCLSGLHWKVLHS